jgi:hypothetical protein
MRRCSVSRVSSTEAAIHSYFQGEKMAGLVLLPLGVAFALGAAWLYFRGGDAHRATTWPIAVGALLQLGIGIVLFLKSDAQAQGVVAAMADLAPETQRMANVVRTFTMLKIVWCVLITGAVIATYVFDKPWVRPVVVGIIADVAVVLLFDLVADARARVYLSALQAAAS